MFASEYSRQCSRAIDPLNWREAFRRGKATLWQTKTGAISPTGDRRAAAKSGLQSARELFSFHLQLHFHLVVMIKSTSPADWGPNFTPLQSQMSEPCVCNVPCNIFICVCVCVNCMCTFPPISIQFQRLIHQCKRSHCPSLKWYRRSDASYACVN